MAFFRLDGAAGTLPRKPAGRASTIRPAPAPKRQGIAMHNPAFAAEAGVDEADFTRF
jgi:methyl-accepting chemotaxis protein